jgi:hypothetical protein
MQSVFVCILICQTATDHVFPVNVALDFYSYSILHRQHCVHARKPRYMHSSSHSASGQPSIRTKVNNCKTRHAILLNQVIRVAERMESDLVIC